MATDELETLLVEDNPADVELTLHAFRQNNLANQIHIVRDGEEALEYLFCRGAYQTRCLGPPPKLILLDLKLPKVGGIGVLQEVKSDSRTRAIPVIVLTSSKEERDLIASYQCGANSYILKPADFGQFRETVRQLCSYWLTVNQPPPPSAFQAEPPGQPR